MCSLPVAVTTNCHILVTHTTHVWCLTVPDGRGHAWASPGRVQGAFRLTFISVASAQDPFLCVYGSQRLSSCFLLHGPLLPPTRKPAWVGWVLLMSYLSHTGCRLPPSSTCQDPVTPPGPLGNAGSAPYFQGSWLSTQCHLQPESPLSCRVTHPQVPQIRALALLKALILHATGIFWALDIWLVWIFDLIPL